MEISVLRNNKKVFGYEPVKITDEVLNDLVKTNGKELKTRDMEKALQILMLVMLLSTVVPATYGVFGGIMTTVQKVFLVI